MTNYMNPNLHKRLMSGWDEPVTRFVDFPITKTDEEQPDKNIPEEFRVQVLPQYQGMINCLHWASELAYEIGNGIPNTEDKNLALGLLDEVCKSFISATKPKETT